MKSIPQTRYRAPYGPQIQSKLDSFVDGLSADYSLANTLSTTQSSALASYLIELACKSQNTRNIQLGRDILVDMPSQWTQQYFESHTISIAQGDDEWECRRLLELTALIDSDLSLRFAAMGAQSSNSEIREASEDFLEKKDSGKTQD